MCGPQGVERSFSFNYIDCLFRFFHLVRRASKALLLSSISRAPGVARPPFAFGFARAPRVLTSLGCLRVGAGGSLRVSPPGFWWRSPGIGAPLPLRPWSPRPSGAGSLSRASKCFWPRDAGSAGPWVRFVRGAWCLPRAGLRVSLARPGPRLLRQGRPAQPAPGGSAGAGELFSF